MAEPHKECPRCRQSMWACECGRISQEGGPPQPGVTGIPQDRNAAARAPDGTFKPGAPSANPGGQPKWMREMRESLKAMLPSTRKRLANIIESGSDKDATAAARLVLEYTLPKPRARVKVEGAGSSPLAGLSAEQLVALATGKDGT